MAKKAIISTVTLNAIGQAIIEKGGATSPMYPKDMPTAIRSIQGGGEGRIPSGGTKGQVLSKKSNADFDLEWKTGGDMRHDEFDALKLVDDLNPENTGITQICLLLNQIKNLLKPVCIATLVSLLTFSGFSAYVETNKLVNLIGKSNVVTGVSFDGLLTGINTNGHPVSVSGGVADIIFPEGGESGGITTNAVKDIVSSASVTNAGAVSYVNANMRSKTDVNVYSSKYDSWWMDSSVGSGAEVKFIYETDTEINWYLSSLVLNIWFYKSEGKWKVQELGMVHECPGDGTELRLDSTLGIPRTFVRSSCAARYDIDSSSSIVSVRKTGFMDSALVKYDVIDDRLVNAIPGTDYADITTVKSPAITNGGAKAYADATVLAATSFVKANYLPLAGGTMTGLLKLGNNGSFLFGYEDGDLEISSGEDSDIVFTQNGAFPVGSPLTPDNTPVVTSNMLNGVLAPALAQKVDKVTGSSLYNKLAALDANGNLKNSGYTASSFATPSSVTNTVNLRTPVLHISYNGSSASVTESAQEIVTAITASNQAKLLMNNLYWLQIDTYYTEQVEVGGQTYTMYNAYISGLNGVYNPFYGIISAVSDIGYKNAQITIQSYVRPSKLLSGYGITNAYTKSEASNKFLPLDGSKKMTGDLEFDSRFNTTNKISTYTTSTSEGAFTALELDSGATIRFYDGRYDKYSWLDPDGSWVITENALESWYPNSTNTFVELEDDYNTNKTAITIGSRHWDTTEEDPEPIGPRSVVVGKNCAASGENSVAIGTACYAYGTNSFSLGEACISAPYSIALGWCSSTFGDTGFDDPDYFSLTWSGDSERSGGYRSHGNGTFNINPKGGPDGFWIGDVNLSKLVDSKISPFTNKVYSADNGDMTGKAGYNVKWAMLGSSRTIIGDRSSEKINKIRFSGAWDGSRGYSAKLLVWVNNGQDPSDSSTTVYALSDNVATEANNNLPIVFEFSNGVSLPEGSRLIVSACDPSKTWNDVKNVTWSQIATTYPSGHGMRWLCGAVQDTGCRTFEENKTEIIQKRCPDAIFTIYGTCASKDDLKLLSGKSFGLSTQQEMAIAISNIIEKLGGSVTSMP